MNENKSCICSEVADLAIVAMGDAEGLDERIFATLDLIASFGKDKWWLYAYKCNQCGQNWMVAEEERIHDNYCLKRINLETIQEITERSMWPDDFLLYEQVLLLGTKAGMVATFVDLQSPALVATAMELRATRPAISLEEIAYALAITTKQAGKLLQT
jgi:hypothetical protein